MMRFGQHEDDDHEVILAFEGGVAAAEGDMSQANRTWEEAHQLNDIQKVQWVCPVALLAAFSSGKKQLKRGAWDSKRDTWTWKTYAARRPWTC